MIGSHETMSYCPPRLGIMNLFKRYWRKQECNLSEQLSMCNYLDLQVRFTKKGKVVFCSGIVDLKSKYTLFDVLDTIDFNNCKCRIVVRGDETGSKIQNYLGKYFTNRRDLVTQIILKKGWRVLFGKTPRYVTYFEEPEDGNFSKFSRLKALFRSNAKEYAKTHNPHTDIDNLLSQKTVHFMDFI